MFHNNTNTFGYIRTNKVFDMEYSFEPTTGNLLSRQNVVTKHGNVNIAPRNLTENFEYDDFDRLTKATYPNDVVAYEIGYNSNGTINYKKFFENQYNYSYENSTVPAHAPTQIDPIVASEAIPLQEITYTPFKKTKNIKQGDELFETDFNELIISYGIDNERRKTIETKTENSNIISTRTKFFASNYEFIQTTQNSTFEEKEILYIFAPDGLVAINETKNGLNKMYYISSDHLGSINLIVDGSNGNVVDDLSYDSWGRNRNPIDWSPSNITLSSITDRGYTSHEQLPSFGLINMNGRIYDPMTLGFLSPDPFVQSSNNSQSYNRFSYCFNNPLKFSDPSGYIALNPWYEYRAGPKSYYTWVEEDLNDSFKDSHGRNWIKRADKFEDIIKILNSKRENFQVKYEILKNYAKSKKLEANGVEVYDLNRLTKSKYKDIGQGIPAILRHWSIPMSISNNPLYLAEAVIIDGGFTFVGAEKDWGAVLLLAGKDAGMIRFFEEIAGGAGTDLGLGIEITRIDYSGDLENFSFYTLEGERSKAYLNFGSIGGAYSWSYDDNNSIITGKSLQIGYSLSIIPGVSFGYNKGVLNTFK